MGNGGIVENNVSQNGEGNADELVCRKTARLLILLFGEEHLFL